MDTRLITNNILVLDSLGNDNKIEFVEGDLSDVLLKIRDYIHLGAKLLTHPLSGSVKPNENPYKSVIIETNCGKNVDADSLNLIENAIITAKKFPPRYPYLTEKMKQDFATVDYFLIKSALK